MRLLPVTERELCEILRTAASEQDVERRVHAYAKDVTCIVTFVTHDLDGFSCPKQLRRVVVIAERYHIEASLFVCLNKQPPVV